MQQIYSPNRRKMAKDNGKYLPKYNIQRKLNVSTPAADKFSLGKNNSMKKTSSKAFRGKATKRRATRGGAKTNYTSAVKSVTSGRPGSGKTFAYNSKGIDKRVQQVSPAQRGAVRVPMARVAMSPMKQNKKQVSNGPKGIAAYRKSIRKSMGYNS